MKFLDRLEVEELIVGFMMGVATLIIFASVARRYLSGVCRTG